MRVYSIGAIQLARRWKVHVMGFEYSNRRYCGSFPLSSPVNASGRTAVHVLTHVKDCVSAADRCATHLTGSNPHYDSYPSG